MLTVPPPFPATALQKLLSSLYRFRWALCGRKHNYMVRFVIRIFCHTLKNIFVGQAVISLGGSYIMATNPSSLFGSFDWFYSGRNRHVDWPSHLCWIPESLTFYSILGSMDWYRDISIQVLGYWFWWLFIIPSLRSRRPKGPEKKALDIAFLGSPLISIIAPVVTKDTGLIWIGKLSSCEHWIRISVWCVVCGVWMM